MKEKVDRTMNHLFFFIFLTLITNSVISYKFTNWLNLFTSGKITVPEVKMKLISANDLRKIASNKAEILKKNDIIISENMQKTEISRVFKHILF